MRKTFLYRLCPTNGQKTKLKASLDACRWTYNKTLEIRKKAWEERQESVSLYDTNHFLLQWKEDNPNLINAFSQCLQNAQLRVDLAFKAFFRRVKTGQTPGYPRFRGRDRYNSFTFPQSGFRLNDNKLSLSKVGSIRIRKHREIKGSVKTLTVRRTPTGKWWVVFSCEVEPEPLPKIETVVGIDAGLESFATFSTGEKIENPRFFKTEEKNLAKAQQKFSKTEKGTPERAKKRKIVAHVYERIVNKRKDFAHKLSLKLIQMFQLIAFEKLNIKDMMSNHTKVFGYKLNKSIGDVAWNQFIQFTAYKAECADRTVIFVNPRNTSKMCSRCGQLVEKTLADRIHHCPCGLVLDRDYNASLNILRLGMESLASA